MFTTEIKGEEGKIDPFSETWKGVVFHIQQEAESHLQSLRYSECNIEQTQYHRGVLDALESVLDLANNRDLPPS